MKNLILLLILFSPLSAEILEVKHFSEISDHINSETLVVLDIDDTLLIPVQMLGCDEWFQGRLKKHVNDGMSKSDSLEKSLAEWEAIRHLTKMKIVEPGTDNIVKKLQDEGYSIIGLTTQGLALATRTKQQLQENHIDLSIATPFKEDFYTCVDDLGVLYRDGILFTSGKSKGESLFRLCDKNSYSPKKIVFINDKATHLVDIENVAKQRGVPFVGLRYAYADTHKDAYRHEVGDYQFSRSTFVNLLSDEEALAQMK